jgi:hypothetical protein
MCFGARVGVQMSNRLIWNEHTESFPKFVQEVEQARLGNALIEDTLLWRGEQATERMQSLEDNALDLLQQHTAMLSALDPQDVIAIRRNTQGSESIINNILAVAKVIGDQLSRESGVRVYARVRTRDLAMDFSFRMGLALTCLFLEWVRTGSQLSTKPSKIRNDVVDAFISVYGTYFNGLMTKDQKLNDIHDLSRSL